MAKTKINQKGFTIIEVVLVLAVAGLIFLMVFIALPALQRSQRNTRRRSDLARIMSAFDEYAANNNGKMPGGSAGNNDAGKLVERKDLANFVNSYVVGQKDYVTESTVVSDGSTAIYECGNSDQFCDPDGTRYSFSHRQARPVVNCTGTSEDEKKEKGCKLASGDDKHAIYYFRYAKCSEYEGYVRDGSGYNDIAIMYFLEGGAVYCSDNH